MDDFDFDFDFEGNPVYDLPIDIDWSKFDIGNLDINPQWDDYLGEMIGDFGDTGYDEYLGINLPTFGDAELSQALVESESDVRFDPSGNMVFTNPDGTVVTYTPEGMVQTADQSGRNVFYHTTDGKDYAVDYSSLTPGELVETFARDVGGEGATRYGAYHTTDGRDYYVENEDVYTPGSSYDIYSRESGGQGPTRYTQYSGTDGNARVVDYSDVYKKDDTGGKVTTTTQDGDDTRTVIYEDGKVTDTKKDDTNIVKKITDAITQKDNAALIALLGGLMGLMGSKGGSSAPPGYKFGNLPKVTATRGPARSPTEGGRRPGAAGIGSLTGGVTYAAQGGIMDLAKGGRPARYLAGGTDGMADKIQTDIDGKQPARLSHGEFVIPADVVSHLGNGNSDAGADVLYEMMAKVRKARTGNPKQGKQINPRKYTKV